MKKILTIILLLMMLFPLTAVYADDLSDVRTSGVLRLGTMQEYIPFVFTADDGISTGMDIELVKEIGRRMGIEVKTISMAFDGLIDALNLGQIDMIGGAFAKTPEREAVIDFSRVYYTADSQFIGLASLDVPGNVSYDSFRDLKIGVQKGTSFEQWIKTNLVGGGYVNTRNVYTYSSAADEMKALDRGDVDLVVLSQDIYEDIYQPTGQYKIFYDGFMEENYAFGFRKNSTLTSVVDEKLVEMMKDGTAQAIANRFFQMDFKEASMDNSRSSSVPTPTPSAPVIVVPTQTGGSCKNGMTFVSDVTITDGHQVSRGESFRKIWRVQNTGTCPWTTAFSFVFVSGDQMSGRNINIPSYVSPGQTIELGVDFIAPTTDGTYRGYWQMRDAQGQNFGETIWVKVRVNGGNGGRTVPEIKSFYPNFYSGNSSTCPTVYWNTANTAAISISVDGTTVVKSYTVNGSQQICGALQSAGNHTVELAALSATDTTYSSFVYKTTGDGQTRTIPVINYFYVSPDSGYMGDSTTAYWSVSNAGAIDIYVDGNPIQRSYDATGAAPISATIQREGTHSITLTAHSVTDDTSSTVYYKMESDGQREVIPVINYFYVDPDSGYMGDSTTAYWSVSNAARIYVSVDGNGIYDGSDSTGAAPISATIQREGTHSITLTARSVTTDRTQTVYYTTHEDGQHDVTPVIDYFYVDPDSGYMGDSATIYYSVSNAATVDIDVDGYTLVSNGSTSGAEPISAIIQNVGVHRITLTARSVTSDVTQTIYFTMYEDQGGWAGSQYYENEMDQGGWAGSNYYENEMDQGGWAGSNYYDNEMDDGGWAGSNYYDNE